jgi:hypothetical protein
LSIRWASSAPSAILIELARKATVLHPEALRSWEILAGHFSSRGENEEAIAVLTDAVSKLPTNPTVHLLLAAAYSRAGQFARARAILDSAPPVPTNELETAILRLELLLTTRRTDDNVQLALDLLAIDPTNVVAIKVVRKKGPKATIAACRVALERDPGHTWARYQLAVALATLGRSEEARRLIDLDQFVTVADLPTPSDYENAKVFEVALAGEIDRNPTLLPDPAGKATTAGFQTSPCLPRPDDRAISSLLSMVQKSVDDFETGLNERLDHPFVAGRPECAKLEAWAVVYPGDGYQTAHIHPAGWLSGVYYVSVPEIYGDEPKRGHLVLGAVEASELSVTPPWGIRTIPPIPGRLVMFPSYVPHATIPTRSMARRICIAFDVRRARADVSTGA